MRYFNYNFIRNYPPLKGGAIINAAMTFLLLFSFPVNAEFKLKASEVEQAIATALQTEKIAAHPRVIITNNRQIVLYKSDKPAEVEINKLIHDEAKKTWVANMLITQNDNVVSAKPLAGRYEEQIAVPILRKRFNNGEIISEADIEIKYFTHYKVPHGSVVDINEIIGKTPARLISKGRPIRQAELIKPAIIEKGTIVQMLYKNNAIEISTIGEALDNGGMADIIRVKNTDSKKVIRAKIISQNQVMAGAL